MSATDRVETLASEALDEADYDPFEAAEILAEKLSGADGLAASVPFASDLSTTVRVDGVDYDLDWFGRLGPALWEI